LFEYDRGILVRDLGLWLDASVKREFCFVSHAHGDHTNRHERILATAATLALARERFDIRREALGLGAPRREPEEFALDFGQPHRMNGATVTLYPAGHILGSAQILIEQDGRRLLYSGDFCPERTAAAEDIEIPKADTLIMECTYGLPEHCFPPREETTAKLIQFVEKTLGRGMTPVCLAYALGKGQEVMRILLDAGLAVAAEYQTWRLARVYKRFGITFRRHRLLNSAVRAGEVVVTPNVPCVGAYLEGRRYRTAAVTGWATGGFFYGAGRADTRIGLSDHADFEGLFSYIRGVSPETVYITHGPEEFGYYAKKAGFRVGSVYEKSAH